MTVCPHTGVGVPECSCDACVQALIERHMPSPTAAADTAEIVATNVRAIRRLRLPSRLRERRRRRAA